jgi:putative alpha-1,2-mannosidase
MLLSFLIKLSVFTTVFTLTSASQSQLISDPASLVNLFIGTTNGGHVFPGATLPHGMVKAGMDTDSPANVRLLKFFFHHEMIVLTTLFSMLDTMLLLITLRPVFLSCTTMVRVV